jgi:hypothetical protein
MSRLLIFLLLVTAVPAVAQRHLAGLSGLEFRTGVVDHPRVAPGWGGRYLGLAYSHHTTARQHLSAGLEVDQKSYRLGELRATSSRTLLVGTFHQTFLRDPSGSLFLAVAGGGVLGRETVRVPESLRLSGLEAVAASKFVYGVSLGLEAEWYLSDRAVLLFSLRERWLINSDTQPLRFYMGPGFKWIIHR